MKSLACISRIMNVDIECEMVSFLRQCDRLFLSSCQLHGLIDHQEIRHHQSSNLEYIKSKTFPPIITVVMK